MTFARKVLLLTAAALITCGCRGKQPSPGAGQPPVPGATTSSGANLQLLESSLVESPCNVSFAVFTPRPLLPNTLHDVQDRVHNEFPSAHVLSAPGDAPLPQVLIATPDVATYTPPTAEHLERFARGLDRLQKFEATRSKGVIVVTYRFDFDARMDHLRDAQKLAYDYASKLSGTIWDESTAQLFGLEIWKKSRMDTWDGTIPDIRQHIGVHIMPHESVHRLVTYGMVKFGLPDLVVEDVTEDTAERTTKLIEAVSQLLVEGQSPGTSGELDVDVKAIRHSIVRPFLVASGGAGATLHARIPLVPAGQIPGDPDNRLVKLDLPGETGTYLSRLETLLAAFWGAPVPQ
jgi:hypothetical protein